jgi:hypothetical protein
MILPMVIRSVPVVIIAAVSLLPFGSTSHRL